MNRSLKLSVLVALALGSAPALALDLGQIQVKSALDRPLVAEIPLHPDHPGEADHLKVTLAPAAAFARAGISRAHLKVPLTFKVVTDAQGQKVIRVTSTQPVREPYLDFLIQVSWPKGKLLREYTVLLDPLSMSSTPGVVPAKAPPAQPANTHQASPSAQTAPASAQATSSQTSMPSGKDVYGPVQHGDTLSHIARVDAISGVSYQQMLVALKAANPDAFFRDNVNALKAGAILRIPTRAQALAVSRQAAIAAVRKQNAAWQNLHASAPTMVASAGGSSAPIAGLPQGASGGDHLHLVPPKAGSGQASADAAGGDGQATVSELRQDLARSKEALSSQKQASADLKSRVAALEQIADKNKRLIGLKNAEIAALQQKLAAARQQAGLPALPTSALAPTQASVATATSSAAVVAPMSAASTANATSPAIASTVAGTAAASAKHKAPAQQSATRTAPDPASANHATTPATPWYQQLWARVVLAIIIVLLLAWMVLRRRKPSKQEPKPSLADAYDDSSLGHGAAAAAAEGEDTMESPSTMAEDDGENELLTQLGEHPDNIGLHLELASLYYARHDAGQFEGAAEAMHAYVDDENSPEWQEVVAMGHELAPDHPLFAQDDVDAIDAVDPQAPFEAVEPDAEESFVSAEEPAAEAHDLDYDFSIDPQPEKPAEPELTDTGLPDESEFDALPPLPADAGDEAAEPPADIAPEPAEPETTPDVEPVLTTTFATDDLDDDGVEDGFSDDPVDTKLDLARAYMDMGDHDGARAMLNEAVREGSRMQQDTAQKLLDELA